MYIKTFIFNKFYQPYLVLLTMVPRNRDSHQVPKHEERFSLNIYVRTVFIFRYGVARYISGGRGRSAGTSSTDVITTGTSFSINRGMPWFKWFYLFESWVRAPGGSDF